MEKVREKVVQLDSIWDTSAFIKTILKTLIRGEVRAIGLYCFGSDLEPHF